MQRDLRARHSECWLIARSVAVIVGSSSDVNCSADEVSAGVVMPHRPQTPCLQRSLENAFFVANSEN